MFPGFQNHSVSSNHHSVSSLGPVSLYQCLPWYSYLGASAHTNGALPGRAGSVQRQESSVLPNSACLSLITGPTSGSRRLCSRTKSCTKKLLTLSSYHFILKYIYNLNYFYIHITIFFSRNFNCRNDWNVKHKGLQ